MKLVRFGQPGREKPGLLDLTGQIRDLSAYVPDIAGSALLPDGLSVLASLDPHTLPLAPDGIRLGACVGAVGQFIGVGLNYADHAAEVGANKKPRSEPRLFAKMPGCIAGPYDDVIIPPGAEKLDWEVELGVVIGRPGFAIDEADALAHVAGYCVVNDLSERAWQLEHGGDWLKGKSGPGFGPIGPWLVTADEVPDPQALSLCCTVDGVVMQQASTAQMLFGVAYLVSYCSRFMALSPGDIIATGTPAGVGLARTPPMFLRAGQTMRLSVEGLGEQVQRVVAG